MKGSRFSCQESRIKNQHLHLVANNPQEKQELNKSSYKIVPEVETLNLDILRVTLLADWLFNEPTLYPLYTRNNSTEA